MEEAKEIEVRRKSMWSYAIAGIGGFLLFYLLRRASFTKGRRAESIRPPIQDILAKPDKINYDLRDLQAPRVTGRLFKLLIWFSYTRLGQFLLVASNIRRSNLDLLTGEHIPEHPSFKPPPISNCKLFRVEVNKKILNDFCENPRKVKNKHFFRPNVLDYYHTYRSGECTPTVVAKNILNAIKDSNKARPPLRAIVDYSDAVVMAMAEASTDRWRQGKPLSLLDGIPIAVKGEYVVNPYPFLVGATFNAAVNENLQEGYIVRKLKEYGAIIIGISNMQEFGCGTIGSNVHAIYKTPRNPCNINYYCGGSSSGSAAAVSAGLCPLALGADGGGSIRIPAGLCGVVGFKPTFDLLDLSGVSALAFTVGVPGPIGTSTLDMAVALDAFVKEQDGNVPFNLSGFGDKSLTGLKVGVYWHYFKHADKNIVKQCEASLDSLVKLGAEIKEIIIPELEEMRVALIRIILTEMASNLHRDIDYNFSNFSLETLLSLQVGLNASGLEYINCQKQRTRAIEIVKSLFEDVDVIVTPGTGCTAPRIIPSALSHGISDSKTSGELMKFAFLANLTGIPALVMPVGTQMEGLPISLQIMASWCQDGLLLKVGHALEMMLGDVMPSPQVYYDVLKDYTK